MREEAGGRGILGCPPHSPLLTSTPAQAPRQVVAGAQGQHGHGWSSGKVGFVCREKCSEDEGGGGGKDLASKSPPGCRGKWGDGAQDPPMASRIHPTVPSPPHTRMRKSGTSRKKLSLGRGREGREEGREVRAGCPPPSTYHIPCVPPQPLPWVGSSLLQVVDLPGVQKVLELPEDSVREGKLGWGGGRGSNLPLPLNLGVKGGPMVCPMPAQPLTSFPASLRSWG